MASYEVKNIGIKSLIKGLPIVFVILGALIGLFTFFIFPTEIASNLTFGAKFLSWAIFVVLYAVLMALGIVIVAALYNWISKKMGGISIDIEEVQE
ncbi:MAG: hypothetical protein A2219_00795 [Elusimicrobia bacterium RIFOXYA2_FULL_50_26]|nr:MAG: hypothetical protein A2219_00795 [Elusimicrobia bacterium RIFOXYA2_FULL_50_26]OGS23196.1 MAG: hypothetical protein A2314_06265 [Elusimicrobia bacterium RIFOXYB2_FULL_50_12]